MNKEMIELRRQLDIMTGKYEIARGIADNSINMLIEYCQSTNITSATCNECSDKDYCNFTSIKSQLSELDK
jgi:hypothetical protein